ncbi:hypothetical protein [Nocardia blacklockiae]|uniref:hypothetical protein n=1 Tax=Nocardia blacklockiae TaxID=480036 RepID=UPI00189555C3|nr:hypothetical protein [Nocardia blacklockiae]MBF6173592.1 hypothetical protein [Nocardia blacklockiae]
MGDDELGALRRLARPRPVLVDTTRIWVPPRTRSRDKPSIGCMARSFEGNPTTDWMPALQYAWLLLRVIEPCWYAEIAVDLRTRNHRQEATFRQWVPWDAVRLPPPN